MGSLLLYYVHIKIVCLVKTEYCCVTIKESEPEFIGSQTLRDGGIMGKSYKDAKI